MSTVPTKEERKHIIFSSAPLMVLATLAAIGVSWMVLPPLRGLEDPLARFALAARWLVVAMIPYAAVCGTISALRFFEGSHDPTLGSESAHVKIHCRVMQNTLEQLVWFAICLFAIATMSSPTEARVIPVVSVCFAAARLLYWRGYLRRGTLGRAPGVQATFTINVSMLIVALVLFARSFSSVP